MSQGIGGRVTMAVVRDNAKERQVWRLLYPEAASLDRPKTRADCVDGIRPCPYVGCRHHLWLDVTIGDNINHAPCEPWDMEHSCSLDVADESPRTLEEVADLIGISRERVRQIETPALSAASRTAEARDAWEVLALALNEDDERKG